jgi:hypothetical protein
MDAVPKTWVENKGIIEHAHAVSWSGRSCPAESSPDPVTSASSMQDWLTQVNEGTRPGAGLCSDRLDRG